MSKATQTVSTRISPEMNERLDEIARKMGTTRSEIIARMIRDEVNAYERTCNLIETEIGGGFLKWIGRIMDLPPSEAQDLFNSVETAQTQKRLRELRQQGGMDYA